MSLNDYDKLRGRGNTTLIILGTSGIGGLLNAITNMRELGWENQQIGVQVVFVLSLLLILVAMIVDIYYYFRAEEIKKKVLKLPRKGL